MPSNCKVSIVILTKNAGPLFRQTLDQIFAQTLNGAYELIVVDSGSTDGTMDLIRNYPARLYTIRPEEFNFGRTRNYGFSLAQGDFIVTLSQDVVPCNSEWLQKLIEPYAANDNVVAVKGNERLPENTDIFYWERRGSFYFTSEVKSWLSSYKCGLSFVNCSVRRSFWLKHQIFSTPFSEDKLFEKSICDAGFEIAIAMDALCFHGHQYSMKSLVIRLLGEGKGWKYAGLTYTLSDCLIDMVKNKWMIKESLKAILSRNVKSVQEIIFPILRPVCIYLGNRVKVISE